MPFVTILATQLTLAARPIMPFVTRFPACAAFTATPYVYILTSSTALVTILAVLTPVVLG